MIPELIHASQNWRTLRDGLGEFFSDKTYLARNVPKIGSSENGLGNWIDESWTGKEYRVRLTENDGPIFATLDILCDGTEFPAVHFYKLFSSRELTFEDERTMQQGLESWMESKVFVAPKIYIEDKYHEELSLRPYRFEDLACSEARVCSTIKYLDGRPPQDSVLLFSKLLDSKEMPPEEVARRMKKSE